MTGQTDEQLNKRTDKRDDGIAEKYEAFTDSVEWQRQKQK